MENNKKAYSAPELMELGEFTKLTQCGISGNTPDGAIPEEEFPDVFQS